MIKLKYRVKQRFKHNGVPLYPGDEVEIEDTNGIWPNNIELIEGTETKEKIKEKKKKEVESNGESLES